VSAQQKGSSEAGIPVCVCWQWHLPYGKSPLNSNSSKNKAVQESITLSRSVPACDVNTGVAQKVGAGGEAGESSRTCFGYANDSFRIKLLALVLLINGCIGGRAVPSTNGARANGKSS